MGMRLSDRVGDVLALGSEPDDLAAVGANPPPHPPASF
jgi:hypothetical protein